eukprot:TRINITY_DN67512_c3_g7_i1.p1 TRINITY_DN67512_c3_g7~~TRINITY_DN67512_c3_g7_i1.p1  ORF type:complete len:177 (-),score=29.92 TRINITY_DN67512_c3_g7_i1:118-648(-)
MSSETAFFYGALGAGSALVLANAGAAFATLRTAAGILKYGDTVVVGTWVWVDEEAVDTQTKAFKRPPSDMNCMVGVVMAGFLGIYGIILAVIIQAQLSSPTYGLAQGYKHLAAGLTVGGSCLVSGVALGMIGSHVKQAKSFTTWLLTMIFAESLGLYGLIVALLLCNQVGGSPVSL